MPGRRTVIAAGLPDYELLAPGNTQSQTQFWPARPVEVVGPFAPGGVTEQMARVISVVPSPRKVGFDPAKDVGRIGRTGDGLVGFMIHPSLGDDRLRP